MRVIEQERTHQQLSIKCGHQADSQTCSSEWQQRHISEANWNFDWFLLFQMSSSSEGI